MSGVRLFRGWNRGHRWEILLCLVIGTLVTVPAYWWAYQHRQYERSEKARLAAQPVLVSLASRLEAIEEKLMALQVLWSASQKVEPSEWELALRSLKLYKFPEVKAVAVVRLSRKDGEIPSSINDPRNCCDRKFLYLSFFDIPSDRRQSFASRLERVCCGLCSRTGARRRLIPMDTHLAAAIHSETRLVSPDQDGEDWIILAFDPESILQQVAGAHQYPGDLIVQFAEQQWGHANSPFISSRFVYGRGTSGFWKEIPWYGQVLRVQFNPEETHAGALHEWLPALTLVLGFLGTGLAVLTVTQFDRLRIRFARVRQHLVQLLNDSERRYQKVFEHVHQPLLIVDQELRIRECNPAAVTFFGQSPVGRSLCDFCPEGCSPEGKLVGCRWLTPSSGENGSWLIETSLRLGGEQTREVVGLVSCMELAQGTSYVITLLDMTEQKAIQRQLEENARSLQAANIRLRAYSQEIENSARAKITLLASMSHEIRTPLSAILGYARLLSEEILRRLPAEQSENSGSNGAGGISENTPSGSPQPPLQPDPIILEATEGLVRNSEYLLEMINTILDFSKLESGRMEVECIPTDPIAIARDVVRMLAGKAREKNLRLELEIKGPIPQTIQSDPTRLQQILVNLTDNAIKFTREGRVWIEIELDRTPVDQPLLEFRVCDTGVGMSPDQIGRLFQPFRQGEAGTYRQYGGTGLGLLISRRLARLLGGDISVESTPGKGSIFHVRVATGPLENVPLVDGQDLDNAAALDRNRLMGAKQESPSALPSARSPRTIPGRLKGRVLVAEDFLDNRRLVQRILEKAGLTVTTVENGRDAIVQYHQARHRHRPFELILMDVEMPEMDGITAVRELRQSGCTIPILALTAHHDPQCVEQFLESGFSGYVPKPVHREQLLEAVAQFLGKPYSQSRGSPSNWKEPWQVEKTVPDDVPSLTASY
ncbi:MAG: hypothetical protein KatS3mg112_1654 [Thermogutta sp.]|nr:MAG: hypothetical protein KatS3mg112_1654 [Thermogutta sp.]